MHGPGRAGLLHRRAGSSMDCFADVAIARVESGWALNATDLLGISANPGEMGEWYVLTPGEQGGRRAFRIDANAAGLRLHPAPLLPAARRSTRTSCHWTTCASRTTTPGTLVPRRRPAKPSCAWCPSIAPWPPRSAADWDAPPAAFCRRRRFRPRHGAVPAARQARSGQQEQDRRVAADQRYRHARHRQRPGARATFPQASSTRLHRLAVDSSLAAVSLAWRGGIRDAHGLCLAAPLSTRCPGGRRADGRAGRRGRSHAGMIRQPALSVRYAASACARCAPQCRQRNRYPPITAPFSVMSGSTSSGQPSSRIAAWASGMSLSRSQPTGPR